MPSWQADKSLVGVGPGAIDEKSGKAIFGTPGPGTYKVPSLWNNDASIPPEGKAGKHVFGCGPHFTAQARTQLPTFDDSVSPGPQKFEPKYSVVEANVRQAPFGVSDRRTEAKRFISRTLIGEDATASPGPGTYRVKVGKGHKGTMGDAPTMKFGTATRPAINFCMGDASPGAKYNMPTCNDSPGYSFGPLNSREEGRLRNRLEEAGNVTKLYLGVSMSANADMQHTPAPGAYNHTKTLTASAAHPCAPKFSIAEASRDKRAKLCMGGNDFDTDKLGTESPNKFYDPVSTLGKQGGGMPRSKRWHSPEKGAMFAGPLISKHHQSEALGCESPGPIYKNKFNASVDLPPKYSFPKGGRSAVTTGSTDFPAPNTYLIKKDAAHYKFGVSQSYGIASNIRTDWSKFSGTADMPGPGQYNVDTGVSNPDVRLPRAPAFKLGEVIGKHGRSTSLIPQGANLAPGPGTYIGIHETFVDKEGAPKFTFGGRDGTTKDGKPSTSRRPALEAQEAGDAAAHGGASKGHKPAATKGNRFFSRLQDEACKGADSPGPGTRNMREMTGRGEARLIRAYTGRFDRADRDKSSKIYISKMHTSGTLGCDAPGPGHYNPKTGFTVDATSKFKRNGAASWGTAKRPGAATVRF